MKLKPYLELIRWSKPGGTLLVFLPHAYGLTMAAFSLNINLREYLAWLLKFLVWSFLARSLGCTINDICDREYDYLVERTKNRPIPSGQISVQSACRFLVIQTVLFGATLWTSNMTMLWYRVMCFPLIFIYPLMKRVVWVPQVWLGFAMNWGAVMAWTTVYGDIKFTVIAPLFCGLWAWTMYYDTIYACQDQIDDAKIGIGSAALALQGYLPVSLSFFAFSFISFLGVALWFNGHGARSLAFCIVAAIAEMLYQILTLNPTDPATCKGNLKRNANFGVVLWLAMAAEYIFKIACH